MLRVHSRFLIHCGCAAHAPISRGCNTSQLDSVNQQNAEAKLATLAFTKSIAWKKDPLKLSFFLLIANSRPCSPKLIPDPLSLLLFLLISIDVTIFVPY